MINQLIIERLTVDLKIAPLNIIREYFEMEVLNAVSASPFAEEIAFYGGTALRLAYGSFRFSEDLDFLMIRKRKNRNHDLQNALEKVAAHNEGVEVKEIKDKRNTLFGLLRLSHPLLKHAIHIKIEINKTKNGIHVENHLLVSPVSTKQVILQTATLSSFINLKQIAIQNRNLPRDWFDLWYVNQKLKTNFRPKDAFPFSQKEFTNELKRWLPKDKWKIIETVYNSYQ